MRDCMAYGGPDNGGQFINHEQGIAFGHRRLSILDLSEAGNQPFYWNDLVLSFNGELYNFDEVRKQLDAHYSFESQTDTEVLLKAIEHWGLEKAIGKFRGMFAFTLWNKKTNTLSLCRDRVGVKPLYYYQKDGLFLFASELKSFHSHPNFDKSINHDAVSLFLQQGYIPAPRSIFKYVSKVNPGEIIEVSSKGECTRKRYWDVQNIYENSSLDQRKEEEIKEELKSILLESFSLRMVADVPVGMFLSGGVDSSLVTSMLQANTNTQLKTFTIGFEDENYNEAGHAKAVAQHIGSDHTEIYCGESDFQSIIPKIPEMLDEPMGDPSIIPTHLVAKLAKEQVTVSLSADGGDEIFGGYSKYEVTKNFFPKIQRIPRPIRKALASTSGKVDPAWLDKNSKNIPVLKNYTGLSTKWPKLRNALLSSSMVEFFSQSSSYINEKQLRSLGGRSVSRLPFTLSEQENKIVGMLGVLDMATYMEGDILTKVDRATMQVALEGRDPLLDHKIIEFALRLPDSLKIDSTNTKLILRDILYQYVPKELIERPKQGFAIPIGKWLRTSLKPALEELMQDNDFAELFELNLDTINQMITAFLAEKNTADASFVYFLYTLHSWYLHWLK